MSKAKYVIVNGDHNIGILWENEKLGKILVTNVEKIDLNFNLEIFNTETSKKEVNIDLRDFLLEVLPVSESK